MAQKPHERSMSPLQPFVIIKVLDPDTFYRGDAMKLPKGTYNAITDVHGVNVGHVTLYEQIDEANTICTGVTAILPHGGNIFQEKLPAGCHVINGFGKTTGLIQMEELGLLESPIMLTNTFSVGAVLQGTLDYMLEADKTIGDTTSTINIVVGECNDSYLNSIRLQAVQREHAFEAIKRAASGPVEQGAVGAGKGMVCFGYKGGIGSSSRIVDQYTVGCLVLSNFGNREDARFADWETNDIETPDGSIMIIVAMDAPLYDRQLKRLAKRATAGLGRTGSTIANGSGDIAIAFSTANRHAHTAKTPLTSYSFIRDDHPIMNKLFQAVIEATEEAIKNSLHYAETTYGRKGRVISKAPIID